MVRTCEKERSRVCREDTGDGGAGKKEKGKASEEVVGCGAGDMESVGVVEEDVVNRGVWRKKTRCGDPE